MSYSMYSLDFWNYNIPIQSWIVLSLGLISLCFGIFIFNKLKENKKIIKKTTKVIYIILIILSILLFILSLVLLSYFPAPIRNK